MNKPTFRVAIVLAALAVSAILTAGAAARRTDAIACDAATTSTITWASGTTRITYHWVDASGVQTGTGEIDPRGPGTVSPDTPSNSVWLIATYTKKRDPSFETRANCL
jgi:hypothetical protein